MIFGDLIVFMLFSWCQTPFKVLPLCGPGLTLPCLPRSWCASILAFAPSEACGLARHLRKPILNLASSCFKPNRGRKQIGGMMQTWSLFFATFAVQKIYNLGTCGPSFPLSCESSFTLHAFRSAAWLFQFLMHAVWWFNQNNPLAYFTKHTLMMYCFLRLCLAFML